MKSTDCSIILTKKCEGEQRGKSTKQTSVNIGQVVVTIPRMYFSVIVYERVCLTTNHDESSSVVDDVLESGIVAYILTFREEECAV